MIEGSVAAPKLKQQIADGIFERSVVSGKEFRLLLIEAVKPSFVVTPAALK